MMEAKNKHEVEHLLKASVTKIKCISNSVANKNEQFGV